VQNKTRPAPMPRPKPITDRDLAKWREEQGL
jgi:hypothetical protein